MFKFTDKVVHILLIVGSIIVTAFIMNIIVVKPMNKIHDIEMNRQIKQNDKVMGMFLELAKVEKYKIENTFTIKKPKKGSELAIVLDNKLSPDKEVTDGLDNIIKRATEQEAVVVKKTFWQRLFNK